MSNATLEMMQEIEQAAQGVIVGYEAQVEQIRTEDVYKRQEQLLGEFSMDACWDQAVEAENLAQAKAYSTRLSDLAGQLEAASAQLVDLDKGQATAFDFS